MAESLSGRIADHVRQRVLAALEREGRPVRRSHVAVGTFAWDDCCGMLVVGPERIYRTESFPEEYTGIERCGSPVAVVNLAILLVRCVPVLDDGGNAPEAAVLDRAFRDILDDGQTVWDTLEAPLGDGWDRAGLQQTFSGEEGGCIGVETRVTVGVDLDEWDG